MPPQRTQRELAVRFEIIGTPQQRGSKRPVRRGKAGTILLVDDNENSKAWMDRVASTAHDAWGKELLDGPLMLGAEFYFKRPGGHFGSGRNAGFLKPSAPEFHAKMPDLSKLMRCIEDGITGVIWTDDKLVVGYAEPTQRYWTTEAERAVVSIYTLTEN